jgi:tetratricopeptide (TPR) repeat protein
MTVPIRFLVIISVLIAVIAVAMVPRSNEWLAVLRDEDKHAQVIALLEPRVAHGENDPAILAALGQAYAAVGDDGRAVGLMERYIAVRPSDAAAYGLLADIYKHQHAIDKQIAMLQRSIGITPQLSRIAELADIYHQEARPDDELALLSSFQAQLTVESGLLLRLSQLRADSGDRQGAVQALLRDDVTSVAKPANNQNERILLAELLAETGRGSEATRYSRQWILQWREPWLAGRLVHTVAPRVSQSEASELVDAVVELHPDIRLFLVHDLAGTDARAAAIHLLETWIVANASPRADEIAAFISACREQSQQRIVWASYAYALGNHLSDEVVTRFSQAVAAEFGIASLVPFWSRLPQEMMEQKSLLPAQFAFEGHDQRMTNMLLQKVDLAALDSSSRAMWMALLTATASPAEALQILRDRRSRLPPDLLVSYARLAGELGQEIDYRAAMTALGQNSE